MEFEVDGNTMLAVPVIERAVMPFLGPQRQMAEVELARAALEKAYQSAGYLTVFVDVPEQRIDSGVVRLHVTEGRIERLSVTGSRYFSQGYIRAKVPEFAEDRVPNFNVAQGQLALVNRTEERRVQPVLRPGKQPGTVEIDLKVSDQLPLSGTVELNNDHAADTTPWRLSASLRYDNLFQRDHGIAINAVVAPAAPAQSAALVLNYSIPLDNGHSVVMYGVASDSTVETLGSTSVLGKGTTLGLRYSMPLGAGADNNGFHSLSLGADFKNLKQRVQQGDVGVDTPLRYVPFLASYSGNWAADGAQTQVTATFTGGLQRLLRRQLDNCPRADGTFGLADQFNCSRQGADGGFASFRVDGKRTTPVWGGGTLSLRLAGQWATQPLVSAEQFSLGGADTVRGYLSGAAPGDNALLGSIEWTSPNLQRWLRRGAATPADEGSAPASSFVLAAFLDAARATTLNPLEGQPLHVSLVGSGLGLRVKLGRQMDATLDFAWAERAIARQASGQVRVHARLGMRY